MFDWGKLKIAIRDMLISVMDDDGAREAFEAAVVQVQNSAQIDQTDDMTLVLVKKNTKPVAQIEPTQVKKDVREVAPS